MRSRMLIGLVAALVLGLVPLAGAEPRPAAGAGEPCLLLDTSGDRTAAVRTGSCSGVRPGALVRTSLGSCTLGFALTGVHPDPEIAESRRFITTAGHCILPDTGERVWAPGEGPLAQDADGRDIGRFVYAVYSSSRDFGLIEPLAGLRLNAQVCHFGGPSGIDPGPREGPVLLQHSGRGTLVSAVLPGRTHIARTYGNPDVVQLDGLVVPGDSGSPLLTTDGRAVGIISSLTASDPHGFVRATRLEPQMRRASSRIGWSLHLITASTTMSLAQASPVAEREPRHLRHADPRPGVAEAAAALVPRQIPHVRDAITPVVTEDGGER